MTIGANFCVTRTHPHTLTSYMALAASMSASRMGALVDMPALLMSTSSLPCGNSASTCSRHAWTLSADVGSSCKIDIEGLDFKSSILATLRAVAKTLQPWAAKASARAEPMPPALQPVISTERDMAVADGFWSKLFMSDTSRGWKRHKI